MVAILAIISSLIMATIWIALPLSRDGKRHADLQQIALAMRLYAERHETFRVSGSGYDDNGQGVVAYLGGSYNKTIVQALVDENLLPSVVHDPLVLYGDASSADGHRQYRHYFKNADPQQGSCLFAMLERPTEADQASFDDAPIGDSLKDVLGNTYGYNMAVCT